MYWRVGGGGGGGCDDSVSRNQQEKSGGKGKIKTLRCCVDGGLEDKEGALGRGHGGGCDAIKSGHTRVLASDLQSISDSVRHKSTAEFQTTLSEMPPKGLLDTGCMIIPSALYLGPRSAASSIPFLTANSITHVLSIGISPRTRIEGIVYHRLALNDDSFAPILPTLASAIDIIDSALQSNKGRGRILVHCFAGISRSPTIIVGYLMKQRGLSLRNALGHILRVRPRVSPNYGFLAQLKTMEVELHGTSTLDVDELPRQEAARLALFNDVELVIMAAA